MKKLLLVTLAFLFIAQIAWAASLTQGVPEVRYLYPWNDTVIVLKGKDDVVFRWKNFPSPAGGRSAYRLEVFEGSGSEAIVKKELDSSSTEIYIPIRKFKGGETYTWQVKQRDRNSGKWSAALRWSFRVVVE